MKINFQMKTCKAKLRFSTRTIFGSFKARANVFEIWAVPNLLSLKSCQVYFNSHMRIELYKEEAKQEARHKA